MYSVCSEALALATQLSQAPDLPTPDVLRQRINAVFENLRRKAQALDISSADAMEAIYAIAAFMDEQILRSPWPARHQWMAQPLQLAYFHETTAGEGFFQRLAGLEVDPHRYHVVEIYYLCMALGFQGKYAVGQGAEWGALLERAGNDLSRKLPTTDPLSPGAYPVRRQLQFSRNQFPILRIALGFLGLALVAYVALRVSVSVAAGNAGERIWSAPKTSVAQGR